MADVPSVLRKVKELSRGVETVISLAFRPGAARQVKNRYRQFCSAKAIPLMGQDQYWAWNAHGRAGIAPMTNTLHRYSEHYAFERRPDPKPVDDDFVVFAMASRGINDDDLIEKYRAFLRLALKHNPVNIGDATKGGLLRPRRDLNPKAHWKRDQQANPEEVIAGIEGHTTAAAVFDNYQDMKAL